MFIAGFGQRKHHRWLAPALSCRHGLPHMGQEELLRHMRRLSAAEAALVRRHRFLPLPHRGLWRPCVVTDAASLRAMQAHGGCAVARAEPQAFLRAMQRAFGTDVIDHATHDLARQQPQFSAHRRLSEGQKEALLATAVLLSVLLLALPEAVMIATGILFGLFYLLQAALHVSAARHRSRPPKVPLLSDDELPVYTVLVPLFRESAVLTQLLQALARLDYPLEKLDIKLLVEEADTETHAALARYVLPDHVEVLIVPRGMPQTKPRALNYGLAFARGELLTIYDAEDVPHPGQLRWAASFFATADDTLACLQAPLAWYNAEASFFSRMLAVDYAVHFHVVLPWLQALGLPLPLGGTSNHFRIDALRKVGGWDPFNVTEDADLGLRLARGGWRCAMLPRLATLEEACTDYVSWRSQRARWIKGWLQTFLVHQRTPTRLWQDVGPGGYYVLYALLGAGVFAALLHPFFLGLTIAALLGAAPSAGDFAHCWLMAQGVVVFVTGYGSIVMSAREGLRRSGQRHLLAWLVCLPFYWLLVSLAAWLAVWDFIHRPHHWRKTCHGFSLLLK